MELSGLELRYLVNELNSAITNEYYISSISAVTGKSIAIKLNHPLKSSVTLIISTKGIWITILKFKTMEENNLVGHLRRELERARIDSIEQLGSERIVYLKFKHMDGQEKNVICEFFSDGNIVLCDNNMQIISLLESLEVRHRTLKPGLRYSPPPVRGIDVFTLDLNTFNSLLDNQKDLDVLRWLGRNISIPRKFVEEVAYRAGVFGRKVKDLQSSDIDRIYYSIKSLVEEITSGRHQPSVLLDENDKPSDMFPIEMKANEKLESKIKKVNSFMEAADLVLSEAILESGKSARALELRKQIAVLEHDLEQQNKAKDSVLSKASEIRDFANELMSFSYMSDRGHDDANLKKMIDERSAVIVNDKGKRYIQVAGEQVELDTNLAKVSSMLFQRAKELERGSISIDEASSKLLSQIDALRNRTAIIHKKIEAKKQLAREWYERYRWFVTTDGLLAIGGRDASSNSALIRKHMTENDIVFHAEVHGSPFFIMKNAKEYSENAGDGAIDTSVQQVAQATISFSRAWKDGLSSADAYWVRPDQIKKGAPTGQFLPKGAFPIEGKRNYIKNIEIRLAIGVMVTDNGFSLICGPSDAVKNKSVIYLVLLPGGMDPMNAAKKIKSELIKVATEEIGEYLKSVSLDDFVRLLPPGQSKIVFTIKSDTKDGEKLSTGSS